MLRWIKSLFADSEALSEPGSRRGNFSEFATSDTAPCKACGSESHGARKCRICGEYYCRAIDIKAVKTTVFNKETVVDVHKPCVSQFLKMKQ